MALIVGKLIDLLSLHYEGDIEGIVGFLGGLGLDWEICVAGGCVVGKWGKEAGVGVGDAGVTGQTLAVLGCYFDGL